MYSLSKFNKSFTAILFASILLAIYSFLSSYFDWNAYSIDKTPSKISRFLNLLPYLGSRAVFWLAIGYLFGEWRAGLIVAAVVLVTGIANYYFFPFYRGNTTPIFVILLKELITVTPFLVFGAMTLKDNRMWLFLAAGFIGNSINLIGYGHELSKFLNRFFKLVFNIRNFFEIWIPSGNSSRRMMYPLSIILKSFGLPILFLVTSQLYYSLKKNHNFLGGRTIDLSNTFSKRKATLIYFIFRFGLYGMGAGAFFYITRVSRGQPAQQLHLLQYFIMGISLMAALYLISLTYRNFLTEYSFSRGKTPGFLYFLWNFPFLNIFAWFISLLTLKNTVPESDRKKLLKEGRFEKNSGLKLLFIIFLCFIFFTKLSSAGFGIDNPTTTGFTYLFAGIFGFVILAWYLEYPTGIYILLGLATLLVISDIFLGPIVPTSRRGAGGYYVNISNAIIYFSLFHMAFLKDVGLEEDVIVNRVNTVDEEE